MHPERRREARQRVRTPAYASIMQASGKAITGGNILNVSQRGMALATLGKLDPDSLVSLRLDLLETRNSIATPARVSWTDDRGQVGLEFLELTRETRGQLQQWLMLNSLALAEQHPRPFSELITRPEGTRAEIAQPASAAVELQRIVEEGLAATGADGCAIALRESTAVVCRASAGHLAPPTGSTLNSESGISGACITTGRLLRCDDSEKNTYVDRESCRALGIRSVVAVPILRRGEVLGILEVLSAKVGAFNAAACMELQRLAQRVATPTPEESLPQQISRKPEAAPVQANSTTVIQSSSAAHPGTSAALDAWAAEPEKAPKAGLRSGLPILLTIGIFVLAVSWFGFANFRMSRLAQAAESRAAGLTARTLASTPESESDQNSSSASGSASLDQVRRLADQGDVNAEFQLAAKYAGGDETPQDYSQAVKWFAKAAGQGHVLSAATLGAFYWAGRGVPQDYLAAYMWSAIAAGAGDEASKYRVTILRSRMSSADLAEAQRRVAAWLAYHPMLVEKGSPRAHSKERFAASVRPGTRTDTD